MLTKQEMYKAGLAPVRADLTGWGKDGVMAVAVFYHGLGNNDLFYKVELKQDPLPPNTPSSEIWVTVYDYPHLVEVLKGFNYYETLRKVKTTTLTLDEETTDLYIKYSALFSITWTEFLELPIEQVRKLINASAGDSDWLP